MTPFYSDALCVIYHGDAREVLSRLPSSSVDMVFTDPPYGHNNNNGDLAHRRHVETAANRVAKVNSGFMFVWDCPVHGMGKRR